MSDERRSVLPRALRVAFQTIIGLVLVAVTALSVVLFTTPLFLATATVVEGVRVLTPQQVAIQAKVPLQTRMADIDTHAIAVRVARLPRVKKVRVEKRYPHTVAIKVTERTPVAFFSAEGKFYEVDPTGVAMLVARPPKQLPEIVVPDPLHNTLQREAALHTAQHLSADIMKRVRTINVISAAMVVLKLRDGRTVELGSPTRFEDKIASMRIVLTQPGQTWNVSNPELPTRR